MKAVTCPQCGSLISKVSERQAIVQCDYCGARVLLADETMPLQKATDETVPPQKAVYKPKLINEFGYPIDQEIPFEESRPLKNPFPPIVIAIISIFGIGFVIFIAVISQSKPRSVITLPKSTPYAAPTVSAKVKETNIMLEFGGKGTSTGLFDNPNEITVDKDGNIYVSDSTLRVQRFDASGKFLNLWNVKGDSKKEAINKLAADADGNVYVLIGGDIVIYDGQTGEQKHVLTDSKRHYIDDFILRDDDGMMYVAENTQNEEFVQTKGRVIINRFVGIHSKAADADIASEAIKLAVDGKGDIYSVYALGAIYGEHDYNDEDLMTFHFTPQGKFVNKFAIGLMPLSILTDNQSRIYILNENARDTGDIIVFSGAGNELKRINIDGSDFLKAMAVDKQNYIYIIAGEKIRKLKAVDFGS
ncbi:MAG: hypothetical protein M3033_14140 [Acidobacteriota bacterium]|nr:hypothetical protein [Acidobacteriota bacterium]